MTNNLDGHILYTCPVCGKEFAAYAAWRNHLNHKHGYRDKTPVDLGFLVLNSWIHQCLICDKRVPNGANTPSLLQSHHFTHLKYGKIFRCAYCKLEYTQRATAVDHLRRLHRNAFFGGPKEVAEPDEQSRDALNPKKNHEFYLRFMCPQCNKEFTYQHQWLQHLDTAHATTSYDLKLRPANSSQGKRYNCQLCYTAVLSDDRARLQRHCFIHLPFPGFIKCAYCPVRKTHKYDILQHFATVHEREFVRSKLYMRIPLEWGEPVKPRMEQQLRRLLSQPAPSSSRQPSFSSASASGSQTHNRPAADESKTDLRSLLEDLQDTYDQTVYSADNNKNATGAANIGDDQQNNCTADLDALCSAMFDALEEADTTQNATKAADTLSKIVGVPNSPVKPLALPPQPVTRAPPPPPPVTRAPPPPPVTRAAPPASGSGGGTSTMTARKYWEEFSDAEVDTEPEYDKKAQEEDDDEPLQVRVAETCTLLVGLATRVVPKAPDCSDYMRRLLDEQLVYLCPECGDPFDQHTKWRLHVHDEHDLFSTFRAVPHVAPASNDYDDDTDSRIDYKCRECGELVPSAMAADLQRHRFTHTPHQKYLRCRLCKHTHSSKPRILEHLRTRHADWLATRVQDKVKGSTDHRSAIDSSCPDCGKRFLSRFWKDKHRAQCRQRHSKVAVRLYDMAENTRLLAHLRAASNRLSRKRVFQKE